MSIQSIAGLLTDGDRPGSPEPTLLPWLARRVSQSELPAVAAAAVRFIPMWPVIADAIASVLADREPDPGPLLHILPPVAAYLSGSQAERVDWSTADPDAVGYAILGAAGRNVRARPIPRWAADAKAVNAPPLANTYWLSQLTTMRSVSRWHDGWGSAYLLPFVELYRVTGRPPHVPYQLRYEITRAVDGIERRPPWFAAAVIVRVLPYTRYRGRYPYGDWLRQSAARLPEPWAGHLSQLVLEPFHPFTADEEIAASHPAISQLTALATNVDPAELADLCARVLQQISGPPGAARRWGRGQPYELVEPEEEWLDFPSLGPAARASSSAGPIADAPQGGETAASPIPVSPGTTRGPEPEGREEQRRITGDPARLANLYVTKPGQDDPVMALDLDTEYTVRCNIGPQDSRSLLDPEDAHWPAELLPSGPLRLWAVLYLDGGRQVAEPIALPEAGASTWAALLLPPCPQPRTLQADLIIYYGAAVVLMYRLTLQYGLGIPPEAELRYRLSRTLADLAKLADRTLSVAFSSDRDSPALLVNGLASAPIGFRYQPEEVRALAYQARLELYHAHFRVRPAGEISRFAETSEHTYGKSAAQLDKDLRRLAGLGAELYEQMFRSADEQTRLVHVLRGQAEARDQPPVLQIVSPADELVPIPWACLYDLPLSGDPAEYEPCPSITRFGPGSHAVSEVPVRCPFEEQHWADQGWKLNQLCPWGFWGLSAIIEHPPSAVTRDLASLVGPGSGPPAILVGYDTMLDAGMRWRHFVKLSATHGDGLMQPFLAKRRDVRSAFGLDRMDVVYMYCHIIDDPNWPDRQVPAIQLGAEHVNGKDIRGWARESRPGAWSRRRPLVVLNGCGSVARAPGSLSNLVEAFTDGAGASGVIGTEITIEQGLGGWAMELFLSALRYQPVGPAIRSMRWEMLQHGNLIGLAYTPYCLAGLAINPQRENT